MHTRRSFIRSAVKGTLYSASAPIWMKALCQEANASSSAASDYRALVVVHLNGGNDGNNVLVPLDPNGYAQYAKQRGAIAISQGALTPVSFVNTSDHYGFHPELPNIARLINAQRGSVIANAGPINRLATKAQILADPTILPQGLQTHVAGLQQWQSATTITGASTGWGGRLADLTASQSGSLTPVLNGSGAALFTVGDQVQCTAFQGGATLNGLPAELTGPMNAINQREMQNSNRLVQQVASMRNSALSQQTILASAQAAARPLSTAFPDTGLGGFLRGVAQMIDGRGTIGASRQMFFTVQGSYDTHTSQVQNLHGNYYELDSAIGAFMTSLDEIGMSDKVLLCTTSDFNRTFLSNDNGGTDHAWGNHQFLFGGSGGRLIGSMPDLDMGGKDDINVNGVWIPSTSVTQIAAGLSQWYGLTDGQLNAVFPNLTHFPQGPLTIT